MKTIEASIAEILMVQEKIMHILNTNCENEKNKVKYYGSKEIQRLWGISARTLASYISEGKLASVQIGPKQRHMFTQEMLDEFTKRYSKPAFAANKFGKKVW